jgi:tetratricopeptide (TPR) repeat protein
MKTFRYKRCLSLTALMASALLIGCQTAPVAEEKESAPAKVSEALMSETLPALNIPESMVDPSCDCSEMAAVPDETYFDRGVRALAARDYAQALSYFERHADAEPNNAQREAKIGLAFIAALRADGSDGSSSQALDERAEIMSLALALLTQFEERMSELGRKNSTLASDLEKREAVLRRLRELTLGQLED